MAASFYGDLEMVRWLVGVGADVNARDRQGRTAFSIAEYADHDPIVALLSAVGGGR